ncbi:MAG TPA: hypothetical protein VHU92_04555 [Streptosporangiaceae bacterium]|jgi:hypothetical protein|nr:hypothetical protein [Streptosporangiaceae bacterium]
MSERTEPSLWEVMAVDPSVPIDQDTLLMIIQDQRRRSRALLYPWVRILSRVAVTVIVAVKRACPVRFSAHATMDRLCLWFLRRFVSPTAVSLLIRHFIVETNLLSFCARNACNAGLPDVALRPQALGDLGNRAVIEHDLNVYRVLRALGQAAPIRARRPAELDYSMLAIPGIDPEPQRRRLLQLDIQTALCLMNIPFSLCLTPAQYRRAVHSMRLDTSLLSVLTAITGDATYLGWASGLPVRVDSNADVPRMVYEHALVCEYAHARLVRAGRSSATWLAAPGSLAASPRPRSAAGSAQTARPGC